MLLRESTCRVCKKQEHVQRAVLYFIFYISQIDKHHIIKQIKAHLIEAKAVKHVLKLGNKLVASNEPARPTTYSSHTPRSQREKLRCTKSFKKKKSSLLHAPVSYLHKRVDGASARPFHGGD